jgi:hypothetical protein
MGHHNVMADLLGQHRDRETGVWRCGVRYTVGIAMTHQLVVPAAQCRAVDNPPPGWSDPRQDWAQRPAAQVTSAGTAIRPEHHGLFSAGESAPGRRAQVQGGMGVAGDPA